MWKLRTFMKLTPSSLEWLRNITEQYLPLRLRAWLNTRFIRSNMMGSRFWKNSCCLSNPEGNALDAKPLGGRLNSALIPWSGSSSKLCKSPQPPLPSPSSLPELSCSWLSTKTFSARVGNRTCAALEVPLPVSSSGCRFDSSSEVSRLSSMVLSTARNCSMISGRGTRISPSSSSSSSLPLFLWRRPYCASSKNRGFRQSSRLCRTDV
mmetsp:Transcript_3835/g.5814  ORF Transcript_3835/g.5814 Transcript_3835/m.5814 type:complete len:208 (-) Transcript_3835:2302-2925(-)